MAVGSTGPQPLCGPPLCPHDLARALQSQMLALLPPGSLLGLLGPASPWSLGPRPARAGGRWGRGWAGEGSSGQEVGSPVSFLPTRALFVLQPLGEAACSRPAWAPGVWRARGWLCRNLRRAGGVSGSQGVDFRSRMAVGVQRLRAGSYDCQKSQAAEVCSQTGCPLRAWVGPPHLGSGE